MQAGKFVNAGNSDAPNSRAGVPARKRWQTAVMPLGLSRLLVGLLACSFLAGCGAAPSSPPANESPAAKQERLVNEAFALQDQATKLLLGISDQQSAEAAFKGLDQLKSQVTKLVDEIKQTGELTPETRGKISAEIARRKSQLQQQVSEFTSRLISNPQLLQSLQPVLNKVNEFRQLFDGFVK